MLKFSCIFLICLASVNCQNWVTRACLVDQNGYYVKIMQNVISKLEKDVKWCNFKLNDVNQEINENLFKWHARGTANYTNGYLINFQKIDVSNIDSVFSSRTVNDTLENFVSVRGTINFRDVNVGYNVVVNMEDFDTHHFTGIFSFTVVSIQCWIVRNLRTGETTITTLLGSSLAAGRRMIYMPQNSMSEVLSRHFLAFHASTSFSRWGQEYIAPYALEVASKTDLPEIRFDYRC